MKKILFSLTMFALTSISSMAEGVTVTLQPDKALSDAPIVKTMEHNLGRLLTEINAAQKAKRDLNLNGMPIDNFARNSLMMLWANVHFYCDDLDYVDRLWAFSKSYMVHQVPLIITPEGEDFGSGTYQEAMVEFDKNGRIIDFSFTSDQVGLGHGMSLEEGGLTVDAEREFIIYKYCNHLASAYNAKDLNFLKQVFSDNALIITGKVVTPKKGDNVFGAQPKVVYSKQSKAQYLNNLRLTFARNKWIDVKFFKIGEHGEKGGPAGVTRSHTNPNFYGVRLYQEWNSANYSDKGYVFLLWDFRDEEKPVIHVRTWQPEWVGGQKLPDDEIIDLEMFENIINEVSDTDF